MAWLGLGGRQKEVLTAAPGGPERQALQWLGGSEQRWAEELLLR